MEFVYVTTQMFYAIVSNAAARRGMDVAQYVSLAISRQMEEDKRTEAETSSMEDK
jgi:hypothetical protein